MTNLCALPFIHESPNAHSYVYITGLSAETLIHGLYALNI